MNDDNITLEYALDFASPRMAWIRNALSEATLTNLAVDTCASLMNQLEGHWDWLEEVSTQAKVMDNLGIGFSNEFLLKLNQEMRETELILNSGVWNVNN